MTPTEVTAYENKAFKKTKCSLALGLRRGCFDLCLESPEHSDVNKATDCPDLLITNTDAVGLVVVFYFSPLEVL